MKDLEEKFVLTKTQGRGAIPRTTGLAMIHDIHGLKKTVMRYANMDHALKKTIVRTKMKEGIVNLDTSGFALIADMKHG